MNMTLRGGPLLLAALLSCSNELGGSAAQPELLGQARQALSEPESPESPADAPATGGVRRPSVDPRAHRGTLAAIGRLRSTERRSSSARVLARVSKRRMVRPNETFSVKLAGRDFDRVTEGGSVDLSFNPDAVRVVRVDVEARTWEFAQRSGSIDNEAGQVEGVAFASVEGRKGNFPIATVTFESVTSSPAPLALELRESKINPFGSAGQRLAVAFE